MEITTTENQSIAPLRLSDPDLMLVNASRNGDRLAFEELVEKYDRKLFRIAQGITHNTEDAEEVVQTTFLKAHRNLGRFEGHARFSTWLVRIALNESFMKLRKRRSIHEQSINGGSLEETNGDRIVPSIRVPSDLADWAPSPESL